jgi:hypothetical protein
MLGIIRTRYTVVTAVLLFTVLVTALFIFNATQVNAEPSIALKLHKDFGYSSFGNDAQGNWTAQVTVSEDATRVEFYLDNLLQLNDTQAPFALSYNTDNYAQGLHTIKPWLMTQTETMQPQKPNRILFRFHGLHNRYCARCSFNLDSCSSRMYR